MDAGEELEALMNKHLDHAKEKIANYDAYIPFAGVQGADGKEELVTVYDEKMGTQELLKMLDVALRQKAKKSKIRSFALFFDGYAQPPGFVSKTDALICRCEHSDGTGRQFVFPYKKSNGSQVEFFEGHIYASQPTILGSKPWWKLWR